MCADSCTHPDKVGGRQCWGHGREGGRGGGGQQYLEGEVSSKQLSRRSDDIDSVKLDALAGG